MRKRDPNRIEMGRRFREARERLNWSREVLAERADLSVSFIADLELGNTGTRLENFIRLCRLLDLNADYVLFGAPGDAVQRIMDLLRDRDEETVRWWSGPWKPCCGPWTNSRQRDRRRPARLAGRRVAHCGGFKEAGAKGAASCHAFSALDRSARFRRRLAPLRRDLAAGAAGSAVPAGSSASCGALWAGAGLGGLRRLRRRAAAPLSGLGRRLVFRRGGGGRRLLDRRRGEQGLQMLIGQLTLHGAVLPGQGGGQLLPSACPQQERRLETVLNGGAQSHLPERGGVSCVEGTHGGLISLVLLMT